MPGHKQSTIEAAEQAWANEWGGSVVAPDWVDEQLFHTVYRSWELAQNLEPVWPDDADYRDRIAILEAIKRTAVIVTAIVLGALATHFWMQ